MDASNDDQDVLLQRSSPDLIKDLQSSLETFLWRHSKSGKRQIKTHVRVREADRLVDLLEPFQELPQLLDPHLGQLAPKLADAFLASIAPSRNTHSRSSTQLLTPVSRAICRLLYTVCKVRGEKVIVRFFGTEARLIEVLLRAIENSQQVGEDVDVDWAWEERYITLLWLSQLLLAPFDLSTISSNDDCAAVILDIPGLDWPRDSSNVTARVVRLAVHFLSSSGKERDAAKVLLVRVSLRRDVQDAGISTALLNWALSVLSIGPDEGQAAYFHLGVLSYVAGLLSSSVGTAYMRPYLSAIFEKVQVISSDNAELKPVFDLAVARKTMIKVLRTLTVIALQDPSDVVVSEIVEGTISTLLESLSDYATPVRLAASKALSIITFKLDSEMATQVIEAVLDSLKVNVTWSTTTGMGGQIRDISRVNPYEWHGLILTLSHLLYRRSPPLAQLPDILSALRLGLSFEQKSTTGASIGTNVRDAACFGIWALARRYSTDELQGVQLEEDSLLSDPLRNTRPTVLQSLANLLVVSACLDPAGNIRRGSSAALQELIGRHPNMIDEGISVVQIVDYHSVALRSRAIQDVALKVSRLSLHYHGVLLDQILGWRGIRDPNSLTRQYAATTFGSLSWSPRGSLTKSILQDQGGVSKTMIEICRSLLALPLRDVDTRHGLILCLARLVMNSDTENPNNAHTRQHGFELLDDNVMAQLCQVLEQVSQEFTKYRASELVAAATSQLISVVLSTLSQSQTIRDSPHSSPHDPIETPYAFIANARTALDIFMQLNNDECLQQVSDAATKLLLMLSTDDQFSWRNDWIAQAEQCRRSTNHAGRTYIQTLFLSLSVLKPTQTLLNGFYTMIRQRWLGSGQTIVTKTTILSCLSHKGTATSFIMDLLDLVIQGMDDHTTDTRGDVGSFVRIEALRVVGTLWSTDRETFRVEANVTNKVLERVLRLAAEKLDKVRLEAHLSLCQLLNESVECTRFKNMSVASLEYFEFLLRFTLPSSIQEITKDSCALRSIEIDNLLPSLLTGYVSSADTGSEDIVLASRSALASFCLDDHTDGNRNSQAVFSALSSIVKLNEGEDKIVVPALEVLGFLYDIGAWEGIKVADLKLLFLRNQKAHFKSTNVKKLDAAIKIYGCLIEAASAPTLRAQNADESNALCTKVVDKLTSMLSHPFPRVRERVVEELWARCSVGKSLDVSFRGVGKDEAVRLKGSVLSYFEMMQAT